MHDSTNTHVERLHSVRTLMLALAFLALALPCGQALADELVLPDLDGHEHRLSDYRGKWVVVNFWATWCPPCLKEIPGLVEFHDRHKDRDAVVLGVNYEDISTAELYDFRRDYRVNFPLLRGSPNMETGLGPILGMPTTYLVNPDGQPVASVEGPVTPADIEAFISTYPR